MDESREPGSPETVADGVEPPVARTIIPQPAIAARARSLTRVMGAGVVLGIVGMAGFFAASLLLVRFSSTTRLWSAVGNLASALLVVTGVLQLLLWRSGLAEWEGRRDVALARWLWPSRLAAWFSVVLLAAAAVACLYIMWDTSVEEASFWLAIVGAVGSLFAQLLAARMAFHPSGPPSMPAYLLRNVR